MSEDGDTREDIHVSKCLPDVGDIQKQWDELLAARENDRSRANDELVLILLSAMGTEIIFQTKINKSKE